MYLYTAFTLVTLALLQFTCAPINEQLYYLRLWWYALPFTTPFRCVPSTAMFERFTQKGECLNACVGVACMSVIFYSDAMTTTPMWRRFFRALCKNGIILLELLKWAHTAANRVVYAMAAYWRTAKFKICSRVLHVSTICAEQLARNGISWQIVKWASPLPDDRKIEYGRCVHVR